MNRGDTDLHDALQKLEQVEDDLAKTVREAEREAEIEDTDAAVIPAPVADDLRDKLTQARADLVGALLGRELETTSTPTTRTVDLTRGAPSLDERNLLGDEAQGLRQQRTDDEK